MMEVARNIEAPPLPGKSRRSPARKKQKGAAALSRVWWLAVFCSPASGPGGGRTAALRLARGVLFCGLDIERSGCLESQYVHDRETTSWGGAILALPGSAKRARQAQWVGWDQGWHLMTICHVANATAFRAILPSSANGDEVSTGRPDWRLKPCAGTVMWAASPKACHTTHRG